MRDSMWTCAALCPTHMRPLTCAHIHACALQDADTACSAPSRAAANSLSSKWGAWVHLPGACLCVRCQYGRGCGGGGDRADWLCWENCWIDFSLEPRLFETFVNTQCEGKLCLRCHGFAVAKHIKAWQAPCLLCFPTFSARPDGCLPAVCTRLLGSCCPSAKQTS
eukprot:scaffold40694_cov21-Tisochrysis_lutea.AAC.5